MAYTRVQSKSAINADFDNAIALVMDTNPTAGNTIKVGVTVLGATITNVTDTLGNTYAAVESAFESVTSGNRIALYQALNILGGGANTVTVNFSTEPIAKGLWVAEYSGGLTAAPTDDTATAVEPSFSAPDPGAITPTEDNELVLALVASAGGVLEPESGFTELVDIVASGLRLGVVEQIQTTATERTAFWTAPTDSPWAAVAASFKVAAGGVAGYIPPAPSRRALHQTMVAM